MSNEPTPKATGRDQSAHDNSGLYALDAAFGFREVWEDAKVVINGVERTARVAFNPGDINSLAEVNVDIAPSSEDDNDGCMVNFYVDKSSADQDGNPIASTIFHVERESLSDETMLPTIEGAFRDLIPEIARRTALQLQRPIRHVEHWMSGSYYGDDKDDPNYLTEEEWKKTVLPGLTELGYKSDPTADFENAVSKVYTPSNELASSQRKALE